MAYYNDLDDFTEVETFNEVEIFEWLKDNLQDSYYFDPSLCFKWDEKKKRYFLNIPVSFDIETTSIKEIIDYKKELPIHEKFSFMYIWQMSIGGHPVYGRTWESWERFLSSLVDVMCVDEEYIIPIYVHNLSYEFQFIRKFFDWDIVFARQRRKPIFARTKNIEFRCSYMLSNAGLAYVGTNMLHKYKLEKLVGDLDYSLIRHSYTRMTEEELAYCRNDVLVVTSYVQELIDELGDITKIPYTNTGFVRNEYREACFKYGAEYKTLMKQLRIPNPDLYSQLKQAFMGGFTHAGAIHANQILDNVKSKDIGSDYPNCMCSEREYPMSEFRYIGDIHIPSLFEDYINHKCCIFDVELTNVRPKVVFENWLSYSKCITSDDVILNNGRVVSCSRLYTTLTNIDFQLIEQFYIWEDIKIGSMWIADKGYLPKPIIETTLTYYERKTKLKGVEGEEIAYMKSKNRLNSGYGMMVTDIAGEAFDYQGDTWYESYKSLPDTVAQYNKDPNRFLYYPWGVWVTALARRRIADAILELGTDYVYADTDSVKAINMDSHQEYFETDNMTNTLKLRAMCDYYNLSYDLYQPKDPNGKTHKLGVWEDDASYVSFKTNGAKRYIYTYYDKNGTKQINLTVSGLRKEPAIAYLKERFQNSYRAIMDCFGEGMIIPAGHAGKMLLTYIDDDKTIEVEDYEGERDVVWAPSGIHMEPEGYSMSMLETYMKYLEGIQRMDLK